jgi:predicted secreted protein
MGPVSGLVLYLVVWFLTFFCVLPIRIQTQGEAGTTVDGTHHGSPEKHHLKKKAWITTGIALVIWAVLAVIILTDIVTLSDIDMFGTMDGTR